MWVFSLHLQWQILERRWEPSNEQIMFPMLAFLPKWHITLIAINGLRKRRFATWIARWLLCSLVAFARRQEHEKTLCLWKYFRSSLCIGCFHSGMDSKPRSAFKKNVFWLWTWRRRFVKRSIQPSGKAYQLIIWECKMWLRFCSETWQDGGSSWRSSRWNGCKGTLLLSLLLFFVVFFCDFDVQARGGGGMAPGMGAGGMAGPLDEDNTVPFFVLTKQCLGVTRWIDEFNEILQTKTSRSPIFLSMAGWLFDSISRLEDMQSTLAKSIEIQSNTFNQLSQVRRWHLKGLCCCML